MDDASEISSRLTAVLDRHRAGDPAARAELIDLFCQRLVLLCRHSLRGFPGVARWEETDDVAQNVSLRLWQSLQEVKPATLTDLLRFTALQIRRELTDLARKFAGPEGIAANHASIGERFFHSSFGPLKADEEPIHIAAWTEFHEAVEGLPDDEKAMFDLLWYQGLSQPAAAALLEASERTIRRRWRMARSRVLSTLTGEPIPQQSDES